MNTTSMKGRTALVTGSTGGLGHAIAESLAGAGCHIVLHGIEPAQSALEQVARLEGLYGVRVRYVQADLADVSGVTSLMDGIEAEVGGVDVLVNNAVVRHFAPVAEFPVECWDRALAVNLSAAFHTIKRSLPAMRRRGWGRIFNMTSVYGTRAVENRIDYVTTKTALQGMTRAVALETVNQGITCNALCPGAVRTPNIDGRLRQLMLDEGLGEEEATRKFLAGKQLTQRFVDPSHVGQLVLFLCSDAGADITGATLPMEGGWLAR